MQRCLQLAVLGAGFTGSNPMVGAVLVAEGRIIGEGYHRKYGEAHAEVNCINSVTEPDLPLIASSTLYVSLEPCAHYGKTPPCADLVIRKGIRKVVVGCRDPFPLVDGKGIEKMEKAGIEVETGVLEEECHRVNRRFFTFHTKHRPYIVLKWAQTADQYISGTGPQRLLISNEASNRLVHKWRSEEMAIMVGTNTALSDDPSLTTRWWPGNHPLRVVVDLQNRLPKHLRLFDQSVDTLVLNTERNESFHNLRYMKVNAANLVEQTLSLLQQLNITSIMIEGGRHLLQSFIDAGYWDEARTITNQQLFARSGTKAPEPGNVKLHESFELRGDQVQIFTRY